MRAILPIIALSLSSCYPPRSAAEKLRKWEERLQERRILQLDSESEISIKRDVHSVDVDADANVLATGFHRTMTDPAKHFGLIHVMRPEAEVGRPFALGQRFQGRYALEDLFHLRGPFWDSLLRVFENLSTSDYGEIAELELEPGPGEDCRMTYRYLEGSPIAGSSAFVVHALAPGRSRLTQIFVYQEQSADFVSFFSTQGLKLHNQVVYSQALQSAEAVGAHILSTDIPDSYQKP